MINSNWRGKMLEYYMNSAYILYSEKPRDLLSAAITAYIGDIDPHTGTEVDYVLKRLISVRLY